MGDQRINVRVGDIITAVNDLAVTGNEMLKMLQNYVIGSEIQIRFKPGASHYAEVGKTNDVMSGVSAPLELAEHFKTLGLAAGTPHDVIRLHYRRLTRVCRAEEDETSNQQLEEITCAYEAIRDGLCL